MVRPIYERIVRTGMNEFRPLLTTAIERVAPAPGLQTFATTLTSLEQMAEPLDVLSSAISRARRLLGNAALGEFGPVINTATGDVATAYWSAADAGRVALTLAAQHSAHTQSSEFLRQVFERCSDTETSALLRGLALYTHDARHKDTAYLLGRTNSVDVFSALACHNPYPAAHFSELEFNQLVLKTLFVGVSIENLLGLAQRVNPTLSRMCEDYYDERVAADRSVPPDIWLALLPFASPRARALWQSALNGADPAQRYYAAKAEQHIQSFTHPNSPP